MDDMGTPLPSFTLFVAQDDKALRFSRRFWSSADRLGAIDPNAEPYHAALKRYDIAVIDLTKLKGGDRLHHARFAEQPEVVRYIGARLASGQEMNTFTPGLGDQVRGRGAGSHRRLNSGAPSPRRPRRAPAEATRRSLAEGIGDPAGSCAEDT